MEADTRYVHLDELRALSEFHRKSKVIQWLKSKRIKFTTNRYGHPVVLRAHLDYVLSGEAQRHRVTQPNWDAIPA